MPTTPPSLHAPTGTTLLLWGAFALLSITLLVLMRTRWGQARPITKCVMLSLAAHLLLVGVASVTRLFNELPPGPKDMFRVSIEAGDRADSERSTAPEHPKLWEQPQITESATPPPVDAVPRLRDTEDHLPELPAEEQATIPGEGIPHEAPTFTEDRPHEEPAFQVASVPQEVRPEASPIDVPDRHAPTPPQPEPTPTPDVAQPERQGLPSELPQPAAGPTESTTPSTESDTSQQVQQLADAVVRTTPADAVAALQDQLESAENLAANAGQSTAPAAPLVGDTSTASAAGGAAEPGATPVEAVPAPQVAESASVPIERPGGGELPPLYRPRMSPDRDELARRYGGNAATQAAVDAALAWLAANQSEDGRWDPDMLEGGRADQRDDQDRGNPGAQADTGITALAVLAFMGNGHTHLSGPYQRHVQHGLEFLLRSQKPDGNMAGEANLFASMYCHGMATLAISEAYAVTGDRRLLVYVQRAVNYSVAAQHPTSGGWRYQPGDEGDMSQFGWQLMALKSAEMAGIATPEATQAGMRRFLANGTFGTHGGLASYRRGERASRTMTAEALVCRIFLGEDNQGARQEAATYIAQELPGDGRINLYYWYYGTLALHQLQGEEWQVWNAALQERLLRGQRAEGPLAGSWDPDTEWGRHGGRVYSTAMAALCLEVYYRYLPLYGDEAIEQR